MNKIKEKKLNSIKSQIVEITDFVENSFLDQNKQTFVNKKKDNEDSEKDTFTLTKIVNKDLQTSIPSDDINFIKKELNIVKSMLLNQDEVLKIVLSKLK